MKELQKLLTLYTVRSSTYYTHCTVRTTVRSSTYYTHCTVRTTVRSSTYYTHCTVRTTVRSSTYYTHCTVRTCGEYRTLNVVGYDKRDHFVGKNKQNFQYVEIK